MNLEEFKQKFQNLKNKGFGLTFEDKLPLLFKKIEDI